MNLIFTPTAWEQYTEWQQTDKSMVKQINKLIKDIDRNGLLKGLGKPESLAIWCKNIYNYLKGKQEGR